MIVSFVCLVPVRLLRLNMPVLYHVNGNLQRAYYMDEFFVLRNSSIVFSVVTGSKLADAHTGWHSMNGIFIEEVPRAQQ